LSLTAFIGFPAAMGLIALRDPIMATLFGRGAFTAADVLGAGKALLFYSAGLPFFIGVKILGRAFFAMENTRTPFTAAAAAFFVNVVLDIALMGPMGYAGLALATSISSAFNFWLLARSFSRRVGTGWMDSGLFRESSGSLIGALVMFLAIAQVAGLVSWMDISTVGRVVRLCGCMGLGIGVYFLAALIFGCNGMKTLKKRLLYGSVR